MRKAMSCKTEGGGQWADIFENRLTTTTPATMSDSPMTAGRSGVCLNITMPATVTSTMPTADHTAYATPTL